METTMPSQPLPQQEEAQKFSDVEEPYYGATDAPSLGTLTGKYSIGSTWIVRLAIFLLPWLLFVSIFAAMSFASFPGLAWFIFALGCVVAVLFGALAFLRPLGSRLSDVALTLCFLSIVAVVLSAVLGCVNYQINVNLFYRTTSMEYHRNVDPTTATQASYKDAGMFSFMEDYAPSRILSAGFKNYNIYCASPVTAVRANQSQATAVSAGQTFNVWAIGKDCCSEDARDFHCGAWSSLMAHGGVRELDPVSLQYYKLAVKKAEAQHEISAPDPIFVHWVANAPHVVHEEYVATGMWYFHLAIGLYLLWQFVILLTLVVVKKF